MRLAAFQMVARPGEIGGNLTVLDRAAAEARARGAALMVAPELCTTGYGAGDALRDLAEPADGEQAQALTRMASRRDITIIAGFAERSAGAIYNSALLATPQGQRACYRKRHLYGDYERALFSPGGQRPALVDLGDVKVGVLICYDVEFPEAVRHLALAGAQVALVPTALADGPQAAFIAEKIVPVRAFENGIAIVYANLVGADGRFAYAGRSCITLPDGRDAARASATDSEVLVADYEPMNFTEVRAVNPYLQDREADLF